MKKNILDFTLSFILIFSFLEILSTAVYPELSKNQIHKYVDEFRTITKSKNAWYKRFKLGDDISVKFRHHKYSSKFYIDNQANLIERKNNIFIFGDSVTGGFGVNLQDTFFYHAENLLNKNLFNKDKIKIYSIARFGDNFRDMQKGINYISEITKQNDIILYQFNFNDIVEVNYAPPNSTPQAQPSKIKVYFNDLRKSFLNHSSFFRLLQHKAGNFKWKLQKISIKNLIIKQELFKKCGNLGFSSLGQYTYSYGAKQFEDKSNKIWDQFEKELISLNKFLKSKELKFAIIISPISLQIPYHEKINHRGLNFDCSTIDARQKITEIAKKQSIDLIDPTDDFIRYAEITNQNDNVNLLFHPYDTNHPNEFGHLLIGKKLYLYLYNVLKSQS